MKTLFHARTHASLALRARPTLRWRGAWFASTPLIWGAAMASSPTAWVIATMLEADARCDHPLFWWGLPCAIALTNALAIVQLKRQLQQGRCRTRYAAARTYLSSALPVSLLLVLLLGWCSNFFVDMMPLASEMMGEPATSGMALAGIPLASLLLAACSHLSSAMLLPWLAMTVREE